VPSPTLYLSARLYTSMSGNLHRADERISFGHLNPQCCTAAPAEAACAAAVKRTGLVCQSGEVEGGDSGTHTLVRFK
jgi:hypothetical protein